METQLPSHIQLLAIDIDGTLLNPEGKITPRTHTAIQAAQQEGIIVTLATARRYCNTMDIATELGLEGALIVYDGAMIVQYPENIVVHTSPVAGEVAQQAVDILVRHGVQPVVHPSTGLEEEFWTGPEEHDTLWIEAYIAASPEQMRRRAYSQLCAGHPDPLRVIAFTSEERIQKLIPEIAALSCTWNTIRRGSYGCAEMTVMTPGCTKASAVITLAHSLNIPLANVMALGDNNNDIPMLETVGWGVAMGQASEAVKAAARAVTASNAEDGVAQAIERYALRKASQADSNSTSRRYCL